MTRGQRRRLTALAYLLLTVSTACTASDDPPPGGPAAGSTTVALPGPPRATSQPTTPPPTPTITPARRVRDEPSYAQLHPTPAQVTNDGQWWGVDSTSPINADTLANVRGWYRNAPTPLLWGRYVTGSYRLQPGEVAFASAHDIGLYFIVPDGNCSICDNGADLCGNDRTAEQARADARAAVRDAKAAELPAGVTLYKDIEEVGTCHGELTAQYLLAWYHAVKHTRYVPAFYGNTYQQSYDFPRAYCAAVAADASFARDITLAQDEPEPQIGAPRRLIGPANAPPFHPYRPRCAPGNKIRIWQYTESRYSDNDTDADEIRPGTHGILTPTGKVT